jgi:hypothetical protein
VGKSEGFPSMSFLSKEEPSKGFCEGRNNTPRTIPDRVRVLLVRLLLFGFLSQDPESSQEAGIWSWMHTGSRKSRAKAQVQGAPGSSCRKQMWSGRHVAEGLEVRAMVRLWLWGLCWSLLCLPLTPTHCKNQTYAGSLRHARNC